MIQVYGQFDNYFSFAKVSKDYALSLSFLGLPYQVFHTGQVVHHKSNYLYNFHQGLDPDATVGLAIGYPDTIGTILKNHPVKILVTVCESDRIPAHWVAICNTLDLIVVPSDYCMSAFRYSGVTAPMVKIRHGIDNVMFGPYYERNDSVHKLLNVSNAVSFPGRKGTSALLLAYKELQKQYNLSLTLIMPKTGGLEKALSDLNLQNIEVKNSPIGYRIREMNYDHYDFVVQPSRSEGFGLIPLEAKFNGAISIYTNATGHKEHFDYNTDVEIKTGSLSSIDTQGNSIGVAPTVSWQSVADAIVYAINNKKQLKEKRLSDRYDDRYVDWYSLNPIIHSKELKQLLRDSVKSYKPKLGEL